MHACAAISCAHAEPKAGENPADHLPPHITPVTWFGERAKFWRDGKKTLFLTKIFGDAMECDLPTKRIRNLTASNLPKGNLWVVVFGGSPTKNLALLP